MVRLKVFYDKTVCFTGKNFNSNMVRLKGKGSHVDGTVAAHFNSNMVRLKEKWRSGSNL